MKSDKGRCGILSGSTGTVELNKNAATRAFNLLQHTQRAWYLGCGSIRPCRVNSVRQEWARTQDDSLTRSPSPCEGRALRHRIGKGAFGKAINRHRTCAMRSDLCAVGLTVVSGKNHTMLYRCTSLARRSRAALQHQGQGQHGGRGSEKTSSVIHRHSRQAWAAAALQQLLIHVLECTRVAQRKGGVETPKSRASIAPEQTSEHSPRVQHLVDLTTRQSGRKDTRTGTYPTRFSLQAKSIRKTDADRIYNTHRHGKVPAPPEICEKSRKKKKKKRPPGRFM